MGTNTKIFSSTMPGAAVLSGTAGALISILDACLVTGYGAGSVASLSVTAGVATATYAASHPFEKGMVAEFAGATPAALNGQKRILSATTNSVTFDATGVADGAATGTITSKVAPAGWEKLYAGTNLAAYRSLNPASTHCVLRVDDTGTTTARVRGYESMTDVSTGTGPFPTSGQSAGGLYVSKSQTASATARPWRIVADDRGFYWLPVIDSGTQTQGQSYFFGDLIPIKSNDPYACVLAGRINDSSGTYYDYGLLYSDNTLTQTSNQYAPRAPNALGGAVQAACIHAVPINSWNYYSGAVGFAYPAQADNGLTLGPLACCHTTGLRGWYPGVYSSNQIVNAAFSSGDLISGSGAMAGREVMAVNLGYTTIGANRGTLFFDTGDWR